ncbi:energy transducer TonB [Crocinitomicaceae bacterium CZZ-1]|uniref:Energy transducer TonB n=1 Tax=Taishania pollutisoli TaxID=2766479 RepID=A0A8J6PJ23_9FLAO|nr:energy transducer TonB [Taishania pollutisoli]MBC9812561.1 energy transducer TonB [Taishania pollutisoli]
MEIIILITALVLAVSLYDFFTSRSWQQVTSSSRNDVVFDERNKEYGAYRIRRDYDRNLLFVLLGIAGSIAIAYGSLMYYYSFRKDAEKLPPVDPTVTTITPPLIEFEMEIEPLPDDGAAATQATNTTEYINPVVVDDVVTTVTLTQDQLEGTQASTSTSTTGSEFGTTTGGEVTATGSGTGDGDIGEPAIFVQREAMFPGGYTAMAKYLGNNIKYPELALMGGIEGKVTLRFIVGKDGNIENVTVARGVPGCPECDKEAIRVVKSMPKWEPAMNDNKIVRSYFNLPITFKIK